MGIRKFAALVAAAALAVGLMGAGLSATFTDNANANQRIDVGTLGIVLSSDTAGAVVSDGGKTLTCPLITVSSSAAAWDTVGCHVQVAKADPSYITPSQVKLSVSVWHNGVDLTRFFAQFNEGSGGWAPNMYGDTPSLASIDGTLVSTATTLPADVYTNLGWGQLGNGEMGKTVVVTYSIEAVA